MIFERKRRGNRAVAAIRQKAYVATNSRIRSFNSSVSSNKITGFGISTVKLYILCHNKAKYDEVVPIYSQYTWAAPIVMKYQDASFENACWKQLMELYDDWKDCDMVGTLSAKAFRKINLAEVDSIIRSSQWRNASYYHFMDTKRQIAMWHHPNMSAICADIVTKFGFELPTENNCNYWMCTPRLMAAFIHWFESEMRPYIFSHPLAMTDAKYSGTLTAEACMKIAGVPYYPHIPFVLERMNKCFFDKTIRQQPNILCVGHEFSLTGAPIALFNLGKYISTHTDYNVRLHSAAEFNVGMLNDPSLKAVIVNTLVCYTVIKQIKKQGIHVFWWIHEWPDADTFNNYPWLMTDKSVYDAVSALLFPSEKAVANFRKVAPWVPAGKCKILTNGYRVIPQQPTATILTGKIVLTIVGTIERRKNQDAFINHVFVPLLNRYPNLELRLVGKVHNPVNIPEDANKNIILVGEVKDANPYIAETDIHVSYSNNEVLPMNILEAMRLGKPVVSTDVGGCSDLVVDGVTGFLVTANAHSDAVSKLSNLIENVELRKVFGARAKERFLATYEESIAFNPMLTYLSE